MKWCFYSLAISLSHFWRIILAVGKCILFVPRILRSGRGIVTHSHIAKFVPRVEFVSSCQNFLTRATHRPLPLTELNTACFRESPPADFGKVPRSVNPVILCHWHNELNTSKYHISKTQTTLESQVVLPFYTGSMSKILQPMSNTSEARVLLTPGRSQSLVNCKVSSLDTFETNLAV